MRRLVLCFILIVACFLVWDMGDYESAEISNSELSPNYPNPFNLAMTDYSIPVSGNVDVVVFDHIYNKAEYVLAGQKMRTKEDNFMERCIVQNDLYFYRHNVSGRFVQEKDTIYNRNLHGIMSVENILSAIDFGTVCLA